MARRHTAEHVGGYVGAMTLLQRRVSATMKGDFVVFLIGMRINRWDRPMQVLRIADAMRRMQRELRTHPELGFLGGEQWPGRTTLLLSYWKSIDCLMDYAKSRDSEHLPAWRSFNQLVGTGGDVGIWHETYKISPGDHETVYVNMPPFGLGKVGELVDAHGPREGARGRLAAGAEG